MYRCKDDVADVTLLDLKVKQEDKNVRLATESIVVLISG